MNRTRIQVVLMSSLMLSIGITAPVNAKEKIRVEFDHGGISAELVDQGDYYLHPDGRRMKFYRKKDVYVLDRKPSSKAANGITTMQRIKAQFGARVNRVEKHQLGSLDVVRIDNRAAAKKASKQAYDIKPQMLSSLDASVRGMKPVFTTSKGQADLLLLPKLTVELNDSAPNSDAIATLKSKYGLTVIRKLRLSADVYSLAFKDADIEPASQFSKVRRIMSEPFVEWAEPQFQVKAKKQQFTPNDSLIGQQWNLIDQGFRGSRCDTDCDANNAWDLGDANGVGAPTGAGMVIAVIDDGVQLDHPDLDGNIWQNSLELVGLPGVDDDGNGYIDDIFGYDFVTDESTTVCANGQSLSDGDLDANGNPDLGPTDDGGQDANPSPRATANCVVANETLAEDNHGTAVAGILAAVGNNNEGIAGVAYNAQIMAVRLISDFDDEPLAQENESFCNTAAEAMEYAAQHADVINNSWSLPIVCSVLDSAMTRVTSGNVAVNTVPPVASTDPRLSLGSKRSGGSPVIFASGNDASGWVKVTIPVTQGEHAYEWRLLRSAFPDDFGDLDDDKVWLDDIVFPDGSSESFETGLSAFSNAWVLNSCDAECTFNLGDEPIWEIETQADFVREGSQSATIDALNSDCGNTYLHQIKDGPAGEISFWVWVSTNTGGIDDFFEFLIDGEEVLSYGDLAAFGFVDNAVAYPANSGNRSNDPTGVIAVGSSNSGDLSGDTSASLSAEERAPYSQYGPTLDLVAPSSDQHLGITTTDRTGADGFVAGDYTSNFGGTSASAPVVSGVAAAMLAVNPLLSAADVKTLLRDSADKIGPVAYVNQRNNFHGFGRVNMHSALLLAQGGSISPQVPQCSNVTFDYNVNNDLLLSRYQPQPTEFCPAIGEVPELDQLCIPIRTRNGNTAVICL